ncbi:hypothetical protein, conserved [Eimeria tenella]|uniref:Uncharacterized protein n=1 Tax=Eimeria tenella TaxID=5802 RepID=U6KMJ5_EIMTE|nr:hypothetical protein, conserved [Eimeria tenella]CDJ39327.1 hypothetical protein, conserved [Eimeria tenella]|eukprot:XP_013230082.1 hypothetical protein, conserved [Eimeria tenella]
MQQQQQQQRRPPVAAGSSSRRAAAVSSGNRSGSASAAAATQQQQQQQQRRSLQRKRQQTFHVSDIPEAALAAYPSLARELLLLQQAEAEIEKGTEQLTATLRDTVNPCLTANANRQALPLQLSRSRLRLFVYNTHANQPAAAAAAAAADLHAPHFQRPPANQLQPPAAAAVAAAAAAAAAAPQQQQQQQQQLNALPQPTLTSLLHEPPPSWSLYIKGQSLDKQESSSSCLSSFFEKILVLSEAESVAWHWGGGGPVEELVIQRQGDKPLSLQILLFIRHKLPAFALSPQLSAVCGGQRQLSLCAVLRCIFSYCLSRGLLLSGPSSSSSGGSSSSSSKVAPREIRLATDEQLRKLFGPSVRSLSLADLPLLLRQHLLPPLPVVIKHNLKLSGDWIESEHAYDFSLDCIDTTCGSSSSSSNSAAAAAGAAATACCVLGLDSWLSASQQQSVFLQQQQKQQLSLDAELEAVEGHLALLLQQICCRVSHMKIYSSLAEDPKQWRFRVLLASRLVPFI